MRTLGLGYSPTADSPKCNATGKPKRRLVHRDVPLSWAVNQSRPVPVSRPRAARLTRQLCKQNSSAGLRDSPQVLGYLCSLQNIVGYKTDFLPLLKCASRHKKKALHNLILDNMLFTSKTVTAGAEDHIPPKTLPCSESGSTALQLCRAPAESVAAVT